MGGKEFPSLILESEKARILLTSVFPETNVSSEDGMKLLEFDHKRSGTTERIHVYRCRYGHIYGFSVDEGERAVWQALTGTEKNRCPRCESIRLEMASVDLARTKIESRLSDRRIRSRPISGENRRRSDRRRSDRRGGGKGRV